MNFRQPCQWLYVVNDEESTFENAKTYPNVRAAAVVYALGDGFSGEKVYVRAPNVPAHVVERDYNLTDDDSPLPASLESECFENRNKII